MKKRLLSIFITAVMVVTSLPVMAFGEGGEVKETASSYFTVAGVPVTDDNKDNITAALPKETEATGIASYNSTTSTLTLTDFSAKFSGGSYHDDGIKTDAASFVDSDIPMTIVINGNVVLSDYLVPFWLNVDEGNVSITGNGKLTLNAPVNNDSEGIYINLEAGDIEVSCREVYLNGFHYSVGFESNECRITSKIFRSTGSGAGHVQVNSKKTIFDGCEDVTVESQDDGLFQNTMARDGILINNCKEVNISAVGRSLYAEGDIVVNNSTLVAKSGYRCVDITDGELVVQGEQSDVYIKGGDKEIEPNPYQNPYDEIYGVYVCNEDDSGISVSDGKLRITGSEGAIYSKNGEFKFDYLEGFEALGNAEEDTFSNLKEIIFTDNIAKVDGQIAKSVVCKMNCEYENSKLKEIIADLKTQIANLKAQIEELTAQLNKKPDILVPPAKPAMTAKAGKKKLTVKWNAVSGASGYQIYYKKKGASAKTITTTAKSKTIKKLSKKKKYTVKVRAYKTSGSTITYGSWSSARTIKTK